MKITIDTKEDSQDEIRKVIRLLTHLIGEHPTTNQPNIFEDPDSFGTSPDDAKTPPTGNVFGNMFDSPATPPETTSTEEKDDDIPDIVPY